MMKTMRASAVATAKGPRKSSQHGSLIGSEFIRPRATPQVHIEVAAANLGSTPYWLRLNLRIVGDYVTRDQLRVLADRSRAAGAIARKLQREDRRGSSRISWRSHLSAMRSRDDLSGPRVRRPDPNQPAGTHVAAAEKALQENIARLRGHI